MVKNATRKGKQEVPAAKAATPTVAAKVETPPRAVTWLDKLYGRPYTPELSTWEVFSREHPSGNRTFDVREVNVETDSTGVLIATINVSTELGYNAAERVARLMASAPAIYRALKQVAPNALNDADGLRDFNAAVEAMFAAIGHYPYATPSAEYGEDITPD